MLYLVIFEEGMASANRNVTDSHIRLVASPQLEGGMLLIWHNKVNHSRRVLLEGQGFKPEELSILGDLDVD